MMIEPKISVSFNHMDLVNWVRRWWMNRKEKKMIQTAEKFIATAGPGPSSTLSKDGLVVQGQPSGQVHVSSNGGNVTIVVQESGPTLITMVSQNQGCEFNIRLTDTSVEFVKNGTVVLTL